MLSWTNELLDQTKSTLDEMISETMGIDIQDDDTYKNPTSKKDKARKRSYYARHNAQGKPTTKLSAKYWSHKVKW